MFYQTQNLRSSSLHHPFLYGCETWTVYRRHEKQLTTHTSDASGHSATYAGRTKSTISNCYVLFKHVHIITFVREAQIKWACHVTRMRDDRIPKQLLYGELCQGKRSVGGQRKRFTNNLRVSLIDFSIHTHTWEEQLRMFWPSSTPKDEQKTIFI